MGSEGGEGGGALGHPRASAFTLLPWGHCRFWSHGGTGSSFLFQRVLEVLGR